MFKMCFSYLQIELKVNNKTQIIFLDDFSLVVVHFEH